VQTSELLIRILREFNESEDKQVILTKELVSALLDLFSLSLDIDVRSISNKDSEFLERRAAFNTFIRKNRESMKLDLLPPKIQMLMHDALRKTFYAGSNYEKRKIEIVEVGGKI